jgi:hypothetical protein
MRKGLVALFTAAALAVGAAPAGANHTGTPGTPGTPNCEGQTRTFVAQLSKEFLDEPGLGNFAMVLGLSVKEVQALIRGYCASDVT